LNKQEFNSSGETVPLSIFCVRYWKLAPPSYVRFPLIYLSHM